MSVRTFTHEEASALSDFARIALGEVEINPPRGRVARDPEGRWGVNTPATANYRKAHRLALMHLYGPMAESVCNAHYGFGQCGMVPVSDALLGRLCHRAVTS